MAYVLIAGLIVLLVWNYLLSKEVKLRKQAEASLLESESRYASLTQVVPVGIFRTDAQQQNTYVNEQYCEILGLSPEVAARDGWIESLHPEDRELVTAEWEQAIQENRPFQLEYRFQRPDGKVTWVYGQCIAERDAQGNVVGYVGSLTDISERKRAEERLRESEQRFRRAVEDAPFPIMIHAEDGEVLQINNTWTELTGYTHGDIPTTQIWTQKAYGESAETVLKEVIAKKYSLKSRWKEGEFTVTTCDGSQRIWEFNSAPLGTLPDERRLVISMAADVTERRQAEKDLGESEERFRSIFQQAAVGLANVTLDGKFLQLNPRFCEMLGYTQEELLTKTVAEITHPDDRARIWPAMQSIISGEVPSFFQEKRYLRRDGSCFWSSTSVSLVRDGSGNIKHALAVIRDISDRKQAESQLIASENKFRSIFNHAAVGIIYGSLRDGHGKLLACNPRFCQMLGYTAAELAQLTVSAITHPDDRAIPNLSRLIAGELQHFSMEKRYLRKDDTVMFAHTTVSLLRDDAGNPLNTVVVVEDISDRKKAEAALRESEERLRLVTENMSDLVCLHDPDGRYIYVTSSCKALLGYCSDELIGRDPYELVHPNDRERIRQETHKPSLSGTPRRITYRIRQKTGDYIWVETLTKTILDAKGQVVHLQSTSREVSDRIEAEHKLKHDALHDSLTGLPNRNFLMERLDLAFKRAQRHREYQFALLFLDLDNFKVINDSMGHLIGDELLLAVVTRLDKCIRETDLAARLGGDEFVILLEELNEVEESVRVAERILESLQSPFHLSSRELFTSTSIGIAVGSTSYERTEDLLRDADLAMYRAKNSGRGQYAIFDPAMHCQVVQRLDLEHDLRKALANDELTIYYQPIF